MPNITVNESIIELIRATLLDKQVDAEKIADLFASARTIEREPARIGAVLFKFYAASRSGRDEGHYISVTTSLGVVIEKTCTCPGGTARGYCWASTEAVRMINANQFYSSPLRVMLTSREDI